MANKFTTAPCVELTMHMQPSCKRPLKVCLHHYELTHYEAALSQCIAEKGINVYYVTFGSKKTYWRNVKQEDSKFFNQKIYDAFEIPFSRGSEKFSFSFCRLLISERFDVVTLQLGSLFSVLYSILAKLTGAKVVWYITVHTLPHTIIGSLRQAIIRGSKVISKNVVTLTNMHKTTLLRFGFPPEKINEIPHSVDVNSYTSNVNYCLKELLGLKDKKIILYIGRIVKGKGLHFLIESMKLVIKEVPDAYLLIVGEGALKDSLQQKICELSLDDYVRIIKPVPPDEVPKFFSICDVHVAPSTVTKDFVEPFGLVYLEAMASSKPSIAFDIPAPVKNIIINGTTGYLVKEGNIVELAEKICYLLTNEKLRVAMGKNAKQKCNEQYSREVVAQKWYISLLKINSNR